MNAVIERIRESGYVEDAEGNRYEAKASAVTFEIGISTLFICHAHRDNGAGSHTVIDPFEETAFKSKGRVLRIDEQALPARPADLDAPDRCINPHAEAWPVYPAESSRPRLGAQARPTERRDLRESRERSPRLELPSSVLSSLRAADRGDGAGRAFTAR